MAIPRPASVTASVFVILLVISVATSVTASTIDTMLTQINLANTDAPEGPFIPDFLGGSGAGGDGPNARRTAMETIPRTFDWAYWDPSGLGENPETGGPYHAGRQVQWESKFSTPSADGLSAPNGLIDPANLDSLGAKWLLDTGDHVAQSGQGNMRITNSGQIGLRIDPVAAGATAANGERFHLEAEIPAGRYLLSLFGRDNGRNGSGTVDFHDVPQILFGPVGAPDGENNFVYQLDINNDSGSAQVLTFEWGDIANPGTDINVRFSAAVIQVVPEPSGVVLLLLGLPLLCRHYGRKATR